MPRPAHYVDFPVRVREVEVVRTARVTPTMVRVTLGGPGAAGFESGIADEHVKLIFADPGTGELRVPVPDPDEDGELIWPRPMPTSREYTVRAWRPDVLEIDVDFVVHVFHPAAREFYQLERLWGDAPVTEYSSPL